MNCLIFVACIIGIIVVSMLLNLWAYERRLKRRMKQIESAEHINFYKPDDIDPFGAAVTHTLEDIAGKQGPYRVAPEVYKRRQRKIGTVHYIAADKIKGMGAVKIEKAHLYGGRNNGSNRKHKNKH